MIGMLFLGMVGMMSEVTFTSIVKAWNDKDYSMKGHVSLWMFPIYVFGLTYGFDFIHTVIEHDILRWVSYPLWIWSLELLVGIPASMIGLKIWDYSKRFKYHWKGIVCFTLAPLWIIFGVFIETIKGLI
jgi:hypothetical protein